ncbi:MAG: hypothetical protein MI725_12845 [Pirellulales bacterium]|nr:hypothetical protein [Pirellulales bacterium]
MSQIDQAFIRAYTDSDPVAATDTIPTAQHHGPTPARPQEASLPAPHVLAHPATQAPNSQDTSTRATEPIPAPHFQIGIGLDSCTTNAPAESANALPGATAPVPTETLSERRPLSTFAAPGKPTTATFHPVFEVDAFLWPDTVDDLLRTHQLLLAPVVEQLVAAREVGRTMVGIAGTRSGVGCTTVHLCLARMLAEAGLQVAIVDGNFARGDLASRLGLEFETGWEDVLAGKIPLAESVVKSLGDRLALLSLGGPCPAASELLASIQTSITAGVLRYHYDMVLFDLGAAGQGPQHDAARRIIEHCRLDASLIVADSATDGPASAPAVDLLMELLGTTCQGLIGNQTGW